MLKFFCKISIHHKTMSLSYDLEFRIAKNILEVGIVIQRSI